MEYEITERAKKKSTLREYVEALLIAALIAFTIRAFVFEAFKIPSGSMIPTLSVGDHIFVNKYTYGLRIPFTKIHFIDNNLPKRGEVVVFIYPVDNDKDFIKRVVGIPGDKVRLEGSDVFINGEKVVHTLLDVQTDPDNPKKLLLKNSITRSIPYVRGWETFDFYEEVIDGHPHIVQYEKYASRVPQEFVVPEGNYFVMGDNRDNSADSREWGFVPFENLKGRAMFVWLSLDKDQGGIRWNEFGRWVE